MSKEVIKCGDCWRFGVKQVSGRRGRRHWFSGFKCHEPLDLESEIVGCTKGVTTSMIIEAITEEISYKKRQLEVYQCRVEELYKKQDVNMHKLDSLRRTAKSLKRLELQQKDNSEEEKKWSRSAYKISVPFRFEIEEHIEKATARCVHDTASSILNGAPPAMVTFCCENCQEPVIVPKDMLKDELRFKCMSCHQENHYDLS